MRWADVVEYVQQVQALLRGEEVEVDGAKVAMIHGDGQAPPRPIDVPWLIGAGGPKGLDAARQLDAGVFATGPTPGFDWSALLWFGTVLGDGETASTTACWRPQDPVPPSPTTRCTSKAMPGSRGFPAPTRGWRRSRRCPTSVATSTCTAATSRL